MVLITINFWDDCFKPTIINSARHPGVQLTDILSGPELDHGGYFRQQRMHYSILKSK